MGRKHESAWDRVIVDYWPWSRQAELLRHTERLRLSADSRYRAGTMWKRLITGSRSASPLVPLAMLVGILLLVPVGIQVWGMIAPAARDLIMLALRPLGIVCACLVVAQAIVSARSSNRRLRHLRIAMRRRRESGVVRRRPVHLEADQAQAAEGTPSLVNRHIAWKRLIARASSVNNWTMTRMPSGREDATILSVGTVVLVIVFVAMIAIRPARISAFGFLVIILACAVGPRIVQNLVHALVRHRIRRALELNVCPDCAFDLTGLSNEHFRDTDANENPGPARCPECGTPWPLLPPPLPPGVRVE